MAVSINEHMKIDLSKTVRMVRIQKNPDGKEIQIDAHLPISKGINDGTGVIFWRNQGWQTWDEWEDARKRKEAEDKREAALAVDEKKAKK